MKEIAKNGYTLSMHELAELLDISYSKLQQKEKEWIWRDWLVEPAHDGRWKLRANLKDATEKEPHNE